MIRRMRIAAHDSFRPKTADRLAGRIELRERRERRTRSSITMRRIEARKMRARRRHVSRAELHVTKVVIDARRVCADVSVTKILGEASNREQLYLIPWSECGQISLVTRQVHHCISRNIRGRAIRKDLLP